MLPNETIQLFQKTKTAWSQMSFLIACSSERDSYMYHHIFMIIGSDIYILYLRSVNNKITLYNLSIRREII